MMYAYLRRITRKIERHKKILDKTRDFIFVFVIVAGRGTHHEKT